MLLAVDRFSQKGTSSQCNHEAEKGLLNPVDLEMCYEVKWDAHLLIGLCSNQGFGFKGAHLDAEESSKDSAKKQAQNENTQMFPVSLFNILFFKGTAGVPSLFLLVLPKTCVTCRIRSSSFFPLIRCSQLTHTLPPVSDCLMIMLMLQKQWMKLGGS